MVSPLAHVHGVGTGVVLGPGRSHAPLRAGAEAGQFLPPGAAVTSVYAWQAGWALAMAASPRRLAASGVPRRPSRASTSVSTRSTTKDAADWIAVRFSPLAGLTATGLRRAPARARRGTVRCSQVPNSQSPQNPLAHPGPRGTHVGRHPGRRDDHAAPKPLAGYRSVKGAHVRAGLSLRLRVRGSNQHNDQARGR
jgi:hypothetical protein